MLILQLEMNRCNAIKMKEFIMKSIVTYIALATCIFAAHAYSMQSGIQKGTLKLQNTLNEPIAYQVSTSPAGSIPGFSSAKGATRIGKAGVIPANTAQDAQSGLKVGGSDIWGSIINLTLKKEGQAQGQQLQLTQLGTYAIILDEDGNLSVSQ